MDHEQQPAARTHVAPLAGRRAIVTGASSGIGFATAQALLRVGATVIATGRRADRLAMLAPSASDAACLVPIAGDIDDPSFRASLVERAGDADILVNAAGVLQHVPFLEGDPAAWEAMWRTNVQSVLCLSQLVARKMARRKSGHIVNITSILASRVYPFTAVYAATKFAMRAISQGQRLELRAHGIKVTEVAPGLVKTEILRDLHHPEVIESYRSRPYAPLAPEQVAAAIIGALCAPGDASIDLIEINPMGQS
jgi:NADP-dependent 3-hydroxy acid dehydrogenase YdfG